MTPTPFTSRSRAGALTSGGAHVADVLFQSNAEFILKAVNSHDVLVKALETAAARFNMMAGVRLVNGADPKVGYRECMDVLRAVVGCPASDV